MSGGAAPRLTPTEEQVLSAIDEAETLELLRALIRCPSENPPGEEEATARRLGEFFARHGIEHRFDEVAPGRPNLIAEVGSPGGGTLVLNGHLDTVPVGEGWAFEPFGAELRDGRVYGRGANDMLAGIAAMSAAAAALKRSAAELSGRLVLHAVIDEEVDAIGSRRAAHDVEADWVIVTEASAGKVEVYGKGQLNVEITFRGRAVHSSTPDLGRNAVHDAAAFTMLVERAHREAAARPYPKVGPVTYVVAVVDGGTNGSIVPAECTLTVDRRVLPTETLEEAEADIRSLLDQLGEERPGLEATMEPTLLFPPLPPADHDELAVAIRRARSDLGAGETEFGGADGATDASWYAARGMQAVIFGPGDGATAHQPDEFVEVEDVRETTRALALTCMRLLTNDSPSFTKHH